MAAPDGASLASAAAVNLGGGDYTPPAGVITRGIFIGTAGDLKVDMAGSGAAVTFQSLTTGWHPLQVTKIYASGTSAAKIVACW